MKIRKLPPLKYLQECFVCDPIAGRLFWKKRPLKHFTSTRAANIWNSKFPGKEAFHAGRRGYRYGNLDSAYCATHRVMWKMVTGKEPPPIIDHKDRNKSNNRWLNLRAATKAQNCKNRNIGKANTSGTVGVHKHRNKNKWVAQLGSRYKKRYLGIFSSKSEAEIVVREAAKQHYGEFAP